MCNLTDHVLLSETQKARMSRCKGCGQYTLVYKNVYLTFNENEYQNFKTTLRGLKPADFNKDHPSGDLHVLLRNTKTHMGVSFSVKEVEEVLEIIREAELFEEVFSILYTK
ncbi:MAG: DUF6686 family protein [Bacteroidota bacterium]